MLWALNPQMLMALLPLVLGLLKGGGLERILGGMRAKGFTAEAYSYVDYAFSQLQRSAAGR